MNHAVSPAMRGRIEDQLARVEAEEDARILLAVESGSRAWGFHSPDSDYDVRFVYVRPVDWHLSLIPGRDVIERPIDDELDVSGWDLRKALNLMLGGNAVIGEWLRSPIVYRRRAEEVDALADLASRALTRRPATWHYLRLMERQIDRLTGPGGGVRVKRLFYAIRPALALRWMRRHDAAFAPMHMDALVGEAALAPDVTAALHDLTAIKADLPESGEIDGTPPLLAGLIEGERAAATEWLAGARAAGDLRALRAEADALHRHVVRAFG